MGDCFWPVSALRKRQVPPGAATQTINFLAGRDRLCGTSDPRSCLATATFQPNPLRERTCVGCSRPQGKLDSGVFLSGQCSELQLCGVVHLDLRTLLSQPKVSTKLGLYEHRNNLRMVFRFEQYGLMPNTILSAITLLLMGRTRFEFHR